MNVYLAATPLHLYYALTHLLTNRQPGIFVLPVYSEPLLQFFAQIRPQLLQHDLISEVYLVKHSRLRDYSARSRLADRRIIKQLPDDFHLINFSWFLTSLTFSSNEYFRSCASADFVEDGVMVYLAEQPHSRLQELCRKHLFKMDYHFLENPKLGGVYVSQPQKFPESLRLKLRPLAEMIAPQKLAAEQREWLFTLFGGGGVTIPQGATLILSQPLASLPQVSVAEQVEIYSRLLTHFPQPVIFKKHPRDDVSYPFEGKVPTLPQYLPSEMLGMFTARIVRTVSIFSSGTAGAENLLISPEFAHHPDVAELLAKIDALPGGGD